MNNPTFVSIGEWYIVPESLMQGDSERVRKGVKPQFSDKQQRPYIVAGKTSSGLCILFPRSTQFIDTGIRQYRHGPHAHSTKVISCRIERIGNIIADSRSFQEAEIKDNAVYSCIEPDGAIMEIVTTWLR